MRKIGLIKPLARVLPAAYDEALSYYEELCILISAISEIDDDVADLTTRLTEAEKTLQENSELLHTHTLQITQLMGNYQSLTAQMGELETELQSVKQTAENAFEYAMDLTPRVGNLETDNTTNKSNISALQTSVSEINSNLTELKENYNLIKSQVDILSERYDEVKTNVDTLNATVQSLSRQLTTLESTVSSVKSTAEQAEQDIDELQPKISNLELVNNRRKQNIWNYSTKSTNYSVDPTKMVVKTVFYGTAPNPTSGTLTCKISMGQTSYDMNIINIPNDFEIGWFIVFNFNAYSLLDNTSGILGITAEIHVDKNAPQVINLNVPGIFGGPSADEKMFSVKASNSANISVKELTEN